MLKFLFSFVLIIFCWRVEAQQIKKDATGIANSVPDSSTLAQQEKDSSKVYQFYLDASIGFLILPSGAFSGLEDINLGYHLNRNYALGLSLIGFGTSNYNNGGSAAGLGCQLRFTPSKRQVYKIEIGHVLGANDGDDVALLKYNRKQSINIYFRASAAWRFASFITLGMSFATAPDLKADFYSDFSRQAIIANSFSTSAITISVGIALDIKVPKFKKGDFKFHTL